MAANGSPGQYWAEVRVFMIHNRYRLPGGEDVAVAADGVLLRDAGHEGVVFEAVNPQGQMAAAGDLAITPWNSGARRRIKALIQEVRPDIVHAHNTWFAIGPAPLRE